MLFYGVTLDLNLVGFIVLYCPVLLFYFYIKKFVLKKILRTTLLIDASFLFYIMMVLYFVWLPIDIWPSFMRDELSYNIHGVSPLTVSQISNINLVPFRSILITLNSSVSHWIFPVRGILGNLIILAPLPIFLGPLSKRKQSLKYSVFLAVMIPTSIELSQLIINLSTQWPNRLVCIDDVILNATGFLLVSIYCQKPRKILSGLLDFLSLG